MKRLTLVLDAMGVIYRSADDVHELLIPFVRDQGGTADAEHINREYLNASLGQIGSAEFWQDVGLSPNLEDRYLTLLELSPGLRDFLHAMPECIDTLWCLSNDVADWSRKLRERHDLSAHFSGFVISGEVGMRKPDPDIYRLLLERAKRHAPDCILVDDRLKNLDAAKLLGFKTVRFGSQKQDSSHPSIESFSELRQYLIDKFSNVQDET